MQSVLQLIIQLLLSGVSGFQGVSACAGQPGNALLFRCREPHRPLLPRHVKARAPRGIEASAAKLVVGWGLDGGLHKAESPELCCVWPKGFYH